MARLFSRSNDVLEHPCPWSTSTIVLNAVLPALSSIILLYGCIASQTVCITIGGIMLALILVIDFCVLICYLLNKLLTGLLGKLFRGENGAETAENGGENE